MFKLLCRHKNRDGIYRVCFILRNTHKCGDVGITYSRKLLGDSHRLVERADFVLEKLRRIVYVAGLVTESARNGKVAELLVNLLAVCVKDVGEKRCVCDSVGDVVFTAERMCDGVAVADVRF